MALKRVAGERILRIPVDPRAETPVYRQVYLGVRQAILDGVLQPGSRLPSTRALASDLGLSRNTVVMAYEQLRGEGYAVGRGGSDTRVADTIPDRLMQASSGSAKRRPRHAVSRVSKTATAVDMLWRSSAPRLEHPPRPFRAGVPATDLFPYALWGRLLSRRWARITARDLGYANSQGYLPLREAIASYVSAARGVACTAEQVFIVSGSQSGLLLAARLALDPGDTAWVEDPGYHGARGAVLSAAGRLAPVPVDREGMRVDIAMSQAPDARAAFVTPSRQLPLGVPLSAARRAALLAWAARTDGWIVEDDYDSEVRFASRPLPAMQGDDVDGSVLYVGTFSKVLFPALRLGYLIVPPALVDTAIAVRHMQDVHAPTIEQAVLADFIRGGHFERHVRRVRQVYLERQEALRDGIGRRLRGILEMPPGEHGLFVTTWLRDIPDTEAAAAALAQGVDVTPLSRMASGPVPAGLVLGYAGLTLQDIADGVDGLVRALEPLSGTRRPSGARGRAPS